MKYVKLYLSETLAKSGHCYNGYINEEHFDLAGLDPLEIYADKEGKELLALIPPYAVYLVEFINVSK